MFLSCFRLPDWTQGKRNAALVNAPGRSGHAHSCCQVRPRAPCQHLSIRQSSPEHLFLIICWLLPPPLTYRWALLPLCRSSPRDVSLRDVGLSGESGEAEVEWRERRRQVNSRSREEEERKVSLLVYYRGEKVLLKSWRHLLPVCLYTCLSHLSACTPVCLYTCLSVSPCYFWMLRCNMFQWIRRVKRRRS